jgi:hypothetical protein
MAAGILLLLLTLNSCATIGGKIEYPIAEVPNRPNLESLNDDSFHHDFHMSKEDFFALTKYVDLLEAQNKKNQCTIRIINGGK